MSTLSVGQHKQLATAILSYLQELQAQASAGVVADSLELNNAIRSLSASFGLVSPAERSAYNIQPHTLSGIFASAKLPAPVRYNFVITFVLGDFWPSVRFYHFSSLFTTMQSCLLIHQIMP